MGDPVVVQTHIQISPPTAFNFDKPEEWPRWMKRFDRYLVASGLKGKNEETQLNTLIYCMGEKADDILSSFKLSPDDAKVFKTVKENFDKFFVVRNNVIFERARFNLRTQKEGEAVEDFITDLYTMVETCSYPEDFVEQALRDRIVVGILDKKLSRTLQLDAELTLQKAVDKVRLQEAVEKQQDVLAKMDINFANSTSSSNASVDFVEGAKGAKRKTFYNNKPFVCYRCGTSTPHGRRICPAVNNKCRRCKRFGHFEKVCRSTREVSAVTDGSEGAEPDDYAFLGTVETNDGNKWKINIEIEDVGIDFKLDTGADVTVISNSDYQKLNMKTPLSSPQKLLLGASGQPLDVIGEFNSKLKKKDKSVNSIVYVVKNLKCPLLGRPAIEQLNLVQLIQNVNSKSNSSVFGELGLMKTEPVNIELNDGAIPYSLNTPRRIPFPLLDKVQCELKRMCDKDVIAEVSEPTGWCAPMVPVVKKNGKIRLCVDLKQLNKSVKREIFTLPTVDDIGHKVAGAKVFSTLDCSSSFWQLPLNEKSAKLTTFITPFGRYYFKRMPYGLSSATEIFQKKLSVLLKDIPGCFVDIDDILVFGKDITAHDAALQQVLCKIKDANLKLNKEKCKFRKSEVTYQGQVFTEHGMKADSEKVKAICELPAPTNITQLRQFMGMVNYLGRYIPNLSSVMKPMSELLKSDVSWCWDHVQEEAFSKVKSLISSTPVLGYYVQSKETVVSADASQFGIGGVLLQDGKPIAYCSRTLTSAERNYAQIEKECLAGVWSCEKFSRFLLGLETFKLLTDHKPLVPLINNKALDNTPVRCQRLLIRLMKFNPVSEYTPGKNLVIADALSRNPLPESHNANDSDLENEVQAHVDGVIVNLPASDSRLSEIMGATSNDPQMCIIIQYVINGWPKYFNDCSELAKDYYCIRGELSVCNGLLLRGSKIVIPASMRSTILQSIHSGHQGINKCVQRANDTVWWSKINNDITSLVQNCKLCQELKPDQRHEPMIPSQLPDHAWDKIGADLCDYKGKKYLVVVDYFSRFIEICETNVSNSVNVIGKLKGIMVRHGLCLELVTDNGPPFNSIEFANFAKDYNFKHTFSSPYFPISNGEAERAVQTAKSILATKDPYLALLAYRSTPHSATGLSPAELCMGRKIRTTLPTLSTNLQPKAPNLESVKGCDGKAKSRYKFYFDKRHGVRDLPKLSPGDTIRTKLPGEKVWSQPSIIQRQCNTRSYMVTTDRGSLRRNRKHIQLVPPESNVIKESNPITGDISDNVDSPAPEPKPPENSISSNTSNGEHKFSSFGRRIKPVERLDM